METLYTVILTYMTEQEEFRVSKYKKAYQQEINGAFKIEDELMIRQHGFKIHMTNKT